MPASVNESVSPALAFSLNKCRDIGDNINNLEQRMATASQRLLHKDIEYEVSSDTYQTSVLQKLKLKYANENHKSIVNGISMNLNGKHSSNNYVNTEPSIPIPQRILYPMDKVQMNWPPSFKIGSGIFNSGNTCYINSVLQALFHIPPFVNFLLTGDESHQATCLKNNTTECTICCIANTLRNSQKCTGESIRAYNILAKLRAICKRYVLGQQEDAMEFLRFLFENMEKAYIQRFNGIKLDSYSKETTPLNQIFGGYIRTEVTCCQCRGVSITFQHFTDLPLDISKSASLEHALDIYFSIEKLDGENSYKCEKCRRKVQATKQFFIERLPNVLCIQLKRFSFEGRKLGKHLAFNERINLQKYTSRCKITKRNCCYKLQASINHLGIGASHGHYNACAYTSSGILYIFDDICVSKSYTKVFPASDSYILVYMLENKTVPLSSTSSSTTPSSTVTSSSFLSIKTPMKSMTLISPNKSSSDKEPIPSTSFNKNVTISSAQVLNTSRQSLVPYKSDSDDEKGSNKKNGWTITKKLNDSNKKETDNASVAGSECSVKSTTNSWQVSNTIKIPVAESRAATAEWIVTSNPASAEQSPGTSKSPSPPKQNGYGHNSKDRSPSSEKEIWVERTKDTIAGALKKFSYNGYSGEKVSTWGGGQSVVEKQRKNDFHENRRKRNADDDYDSDIDKGRTKKMKNHHNRDEENNQNGNRFQVEHDRRRQDQHSWRPSYHYGSGGCASNGYRNYNNHHQQRNWKDYNNRYHDNKNNNRYRGHNNNNRYNNRQNHYRRDEKRR